MTRNSRRNVSSSEDTSTTDSSAVDLVATPPEPPAAPAAPEATLTDVVGLLQQLIRKFDDQRAPIREATPASPVHPTVRTASPATGQVPIAPPTREPTPYNGRQPEPPLHYATPYDAYDGRAMDTAPKEAAIRVNAPEWDGAKDGLDDFIDQCELNFEANPSLFATDYRKVMFAIGNMTGTPRTRIRNLRQGNEPLRWSHDWHAFCKDLRRVYGDPDPTHTARIQLSQLRQRGPVAEHAAEFLSLAAKANATDTGQMLAMFECSLNDRLRQQLVSQPTDNISDFIAAAVRTERRMKMIHDTSHSAATPSRRPPPHVTTVVKREVDRVVERRNDRPPVPPRDPNRDNAEKIRQYRRNNNQCYGCGGDHLVRDCPKAAQTQHLRAHALVFSDDGGFLVNPLADDAFQPAGEASDSSGDESQGN